MRPDLLYHLSRVAQACANPTEADWRRLTRIFRNVIATKDQGITFNQDRDFQLKCYVDASYNCYEDGKSHYGYSISLGDGNGAFYAKSAKIKLKLSTTALSSFEAEYVGLCEASRDVVFLRRLLNDIGFFQDGPTVMYEDNQSCIASVIGELNHKTTKHINPKFHYVKDVVKLEEVILVYCDTHDMIADLLTKPLPYDSHVRLASRILNDL